MYNVGTLLLSLVSQWVVMRFTALKEDSTHCGISYVPCVQLYQPDVSTDVSGGVKFSNQ